MFIRHPRAFTSCPVGFAVQEGLISLDEKLVDAFADDLPEEVSENLVKATVKDLLTMCLGQEKGGLMGATAPAVRRRGLGKDVSGDPVRL